MSVINFDEMIEAAVAKTMPAILSEHIARLTASGLIGGTGGDSERIAFGEAEAAALLGLPRSALRDHRLRGLVRPGRIGKRYIYSKSILLRLAAGLPPESTQDERPAARRSVSKK